jgi:U3 small nucleolar ribonucleoprotein protein LCP5
MNDNAKQVSDVVGNMLQRVKSGELSTEFGLSFLEVKYHMLLNYLINLTYVVLRKCSGMFNIIILMILKLTRFYILGQKIEKDPSIDRLIELRTILEKIRPIDYKLRYQVDKLVKTAVTGTINASDPLNFKANPDNLMNNEDDDDEEDETSEEDEMNVERSNKKKKRKNDDSDDDDETDKVKKYVPPKITPMPYDEETTAEKELKLRDRERKRALNSAIIDEWKEEFLDTPIEISGTSRAQQMIQRELREREAYEEDNFLRLPMTKEEKQRMKRLSTMGNLGNELTRLGGFGGSSGQKRKSTSGGGKKKKKGGKKRKFH